MKLRAVPLLLLCVALACARREVPVREPEPVENAPVVLISIDTLRSDHLPAYGYQGIATPSIDAFRRDAVLFERAYAHVPLTLPSHVSMLTGQLPPLHGVRDNLGFAFDGTKSPTLPAALHARGYATGAAVSAYVLRRGTGLGALFDEYDDAVEQAAGESIGMQQRRGEATVEVAAQWIDRNAARPFFYFLHLFDPHAPHDPTYDADIAQADAALGRFLEALKKTGVYDRALIVLTSDHGEGLGDHGEAEHGIFLYREALQVPLMIKLPRQQRAGEKRTDIAQLIDLFPTIAQLVGAPRTGGLRGRALFDDGTKPGEVYAETYYPRLHLGWSDLRSLIDGDLHSIEAPSPELYDLRGDPAEKTNLVRTQRREHARLRERLATYGRGVIAPAPVDPEEMKKLAALGYLSSPAGDGDGPLPDPKSRLGELDTFKHAGELARKGELATAIGALESLVQANPRFTEAQTLLAHTLARAGRTEEAIAAYRRNVQRSPQLAPGLGLALAALYLETNRLDEAEAHARLGETTNPARAHLLLGRVELARGNLQGALQYASTASQAEAERLEARVLMAQIHVRNREPERALEVLADAEHEAKERTIERVPLLHYVRGDAFARLDRLDDAEREFREAIRQFPGDREAYASLAAVCLMRGRREDARRVMEEFVRARPSRGSYAFAAQTFHSLGEAALARPFEKRAAGSAPRSK